MSVLALDATTGRRLRIPLSGRLLTGLVVVGFFVLVAAIGPLFIDDPELIVGGRFSPPSAEHWLGTTNTGQDVFNQLVSATRGSVLIGASVGFLSTAISLAVGMVGGYFGGGLRAFGGGVAVLVRPPRPAQVRGAGPPIVHPPRGVTLPGPHPPAHRTPEPVD